MNNNKYMNTNNQKNIEDEYDSKDPDNYSKCDTRPHFIKHVNHRHAGLVKSILKKMYIFENNHNYADALQDGFYGVILAEKTYDASKGYKFETHAWWYIRKEIQNGMAKISDAGISFKSMDTLNKNRDKATMSLDFIYASKTISDATLKEYIPYEPPTVEDRLFDEDIDVQTNIEQNRASILKELVKDSDPQLVAWTYNSKHLRLYTKTELDEIYRLVEQYHPGLLDKYEGKLQKLKAKLQQIYRKKSYDICKNNPILAETFKYSIHDKSFLYIFLKRRNTPGIK